MADLLNALQQFLEQWELNQFPSLAHIIDSMDPIAWTLTGLLIVAVVLGIYLGASSRRSFLEIDDVELTPDSLLARLKQDPARLPPSSIISRLGAEGTFELLAYGDQVIDKEWSYRWGSIRNELIYLLSQQNAFGPIHALARYYHSADQQEPDTLRIRRTVLIHKLGRRRYLEPNADGIPAELRIRCHPAEVIGDLGFTGSETWLIPDEPISAPSGPMLEMTPIEFDSLEEAEVNLNIRRTPMAGGGFRLRLKKRRNMWIVVNEEIEWAS